MGDAAASSPVMPAKENGDAIAMLLAHQARVKSLFAQFTELCRQRDTGLKRAPIVKSICADLAMHASLEEEIFYPAVRAAIDGQDLRQRAAVEYASAQELIGLLRQAEPGDDLYFARVTALRAYIDHLFEEEAGIFSRVRSSGVDTVALGSRMADRKRLLQRDRETLPGSAFPAQAGG
jgi:hemerythrin superfamily protein